MFGIWLKIKSSDASRRKCFVRVEPCLAPAGLGELPNAASHSAGWPPPSEADISPALGAERCLLLFSPAYTRFLPREWF